MRKQFIVYRKKDFVERNYANEVFSIKLSRFVEIYFSGRKICFSQILSKFIFHENLLLRVTNLKQFFE